MEDKVSNPKQTILRMWKYLKRDKTKLVFITIMVVLSTISSVLTPFLLSVGVDSFIANGKVKYLFYLVVFLAILYTLTSLFRWLTSYLMVDVSENTLYRLRKDLFNHVESLSLKFFDTHKKGDLMSRFTNDVALIDDALTDAVTGIISSIITLIGVTIMMFWMNYILAIVIILTVPILFFLVVKIGIKTGKYYSIQKERYE